MTPLINPSTVIDANPELTDDQLRYQNKTAWDMFQENLSVSGNRRWQ
jgi:hypothetical protein